jgi:tRNA(Ile)-lysidine synthase
MKCNIFLRVVFVIKDKVLTTIKEYKMFNLSDRVLIGVSGGPDSMCLLNILCELREKLNISVSVAHINHCLRGAESDMDEELVKNFCNNHALNFYSKKIDITVLSQKEGISCEAAGRKARYEFFKEVSDKYNYQKVAIAHNSNDLAETVLMRIMRGTGIEGLVGIKAIRDNFYVRPLINCTRFEIEDYCIKNSINFRIDKTNLENIYTRNKIRLDLIPYIEKNFNKNIIGALNRLSHTVKLDNDYLEAVAYEKYKKYCEKYLEMVIINLEAFHEPEAILSRIIRFAIIDLKGDVYNIEKTHICDVINLQKKSTGKTKVLPGNILIENVYGVIHISMLKNIQAKDSVSNVLYINKKNIINNLGVKVDLRIILKDEYLNVPKQNLIQHFDYDKITKEITIRKRREGDRFIPLGMNGSKKLKDLFIDLKVSKDKRDLVSIVCFGDDIAWVVGYRVSDKFKITKETKNILEIKIESGEQL